MAVDKPLVAQVVQVVAVQVSAFLLAVQHLHQDKEMQAVLVVQLLVAQAVAAQALLVLLAQRLTKVALAVTVLLLQLTVLLLHTQVVVVVLVMQP